MPLKGTKGMPQPEFYVKYRDIDVTGARDPIELYRVGWPLMFQYFDKGTKGWMLDRSVQDSLFEVDVQPVSAEQAAEVEALFRAV